VNVVRLAVKVKNGVYLINGGSGSGKSTVCQELASRGYHAVETDFETGLSAWVHTGTHRRLRRSPRPPLTLRWLQTHTWEWDKTRLDEILAPSKSRAIFLCGGAMNMESILPQVQKRFVLFVSNITLVKRLQGREPARWATGTPELDRMLQWNSSPDSKTHWGHNVTLIDGSSPVAEIVDHILLEAAK
jgi:hypothetical protein